MTTPSPPLPDRILFVTMRNGAVDSIETADPSLQGLKIVLVDSDDGKPADRDIHTYDCNGAPFEATPRLVAVEPLSFDALPMANASGLIPGPVPTSEQVDDAVDQWHASSTDLELHAHLGWTEAEYSAWVSDPSAIPPRPLCTPSAERAAGSGRQPADLVIEEIAHLVRQGYTAGNDPKWSISFDFEATGDEGDVRIEEIADLIESGRASGPDWTLTRH